MFKNVIEKVKEYSKYILGGVVGAFLVIAAMTSGTGDDMVADYVSKQTGITVIVSSPTEVVK